MSNVLIAVDAAIALTQLVANVSQAQLQIQEMLQRMQREGRTDLTDDEVAAVQRLRQVAVDRWESLAPVGG